LVLARYSKVKSKHEIRFLLLIILLDGKLGYVELDLSQALAMDRLRLVFQGQERIVPIEIRPGVIRTKHAPLFGIQHILWDSKDGLRSLDVGNHKFPFIIQMPLAQYPPTTTDHDWYNCTFDITAIVESQCRPSQYESILTNKHSMMYMPFVETRLLKKPLTTNQQYSDLQVATTLYSLAYVPGESLLASILITSHTFKKPLSVSLSLQRTITCLAFDDVPDSILLIASTETTLPPSRQDDDDNSKGSSATTTYASSLTLDLPDMLLPTFTYGKLSTITYRLCLSVKRKGALSLWANEIKTDWPLTVGTLGLHTPSHLSVYSALMDEHQSRPVFVNTVEHDDELPLYESARLPDYHAATFATPTSSCATSMHHF
jgi:hypothetical protein